METNGFPGSTSPPPTSPPTTSAAISITGSSYMTGVLSLPSAMSPAMGCRRRFSWPPRN
jgi:hypothetical protein